MITMSATDARNNIGRLWDAATEEPVLIESAGKPIAVVLSPAEFQKLTRQRRPRQAGCGKRLLANINVDALLNTPIEDAFAEYLG